MLKVINWNEPISSKNWTVKEYFHKNVFFNLNSFDMVNCDRFPYYIYTSIDEIHSIEKIVGKVDTIYFKEDGLYINYEWFQTSNGENIKTLFNETNLFGIKPFGYGHIDKDNKVTKFQLRGFAIVSR